jgi:rare lipoprotein A
MPEPTPAPTVAPKPSLFEAGIASTYGEGDGFEGNLTACGQVFRTNIVQVAHKSLPCGTLLRIEDSDTGRSVVAKVTDRGPYIPGRIVDLSWGALEQLDPTGPGLLNVNVYILDQ